MTYSGSLNQDLFAEEEKEVPFYERQNQEGPHYQSIGVETGIGVAADFLLPSPDPLSRTASFAVGYGANALAQWMRGDWDDFSHGEAMAAGGFQAIPFGSAAKGLKGLRRATVKGALGGAGMAQLEVGIDERRRLTGQELMLSTVLGGTVAGGFKGAGDVIDNTRRQFDGLTKGLAGTSVSDMSAKTEWRWKRFGYPEDVEPSQVKTRDKNNNRNDYTPSEKASVENSLEEFYDKVQQWEASGKKADKYPLYWLNPVTGDMYRAGKRSNALKGKRLSLISKNRYIRATIQSSEEQKKAVGQVSKEINEENSKLKGYYTQIRNNYLYILDKYDNAIKVALPRLTGKSGSDKYMQGKAVIDEVNKLTKERNVYAQELEDLVKGKYGLYGEHGYNVNNERVQRIVQTIHDYSLGDATNFHPVLNVDGFKEFKNLLEEVLNEVKPNTKMYNYPDYVLNYNPNLYPAPASPTNFTKKNIDRILRIEWLTSLHMGEKEGTYGRVLLGDAVRLDGFPNGIPYDQIPKDVRKGNKQKIRDWLKKIGVKSMPTQAMERQTLRVDATKKNSL